MNREALGRGTMASLRTKGHLRVHGDWSLVFCPGSNMKEGPTILIHTGFVDGEGCLTVLFTGGRWYVVAAFLISIQVYQY